MWIELEVRNEAFFSISLLCFASKSHLNLYIEEHGIQRGRRIERTRGSLEVNQCVTLRKGME
jgi:hypothetical protein